MVLLILMVLLLILMVLVIPLMVLMVLIIRAGAGHPPDGSNQAKQNKRPDDQDGSGFIN